MALLLWPPAQDRLGHHIPNRRLVAGSRCLMRYSISEQPHEQRGAAYRQRCQQSQPEADLHAGSEIRRSLADAQRKKGAQRAGARF